MRGEVDASALRRAEYSTDASNYRVVPQVVVVPQDVDDLVAVPGVARSTGTPLTLRGGGHVGRRQRRRAGHRGGHLAAPDARSTIDPEARTARVEPGVVMSDLQAAAAPYGLRFGPDPSTQNRATLGGMIGNNACGPHAVAYGRTADNVVSLDVVDGRGRRFTAGAGPGALDAVPGLAELVAAHLRDDPHRAAAGSAGRCPATPSSTCCPSTARDLAKMLVGTEGTLVTVLGATVDLVPVAGRRRARGARLPGHGGRGRRGAGAARARPARRGGPGRAPGRRGAPAPRRPPCPSCPRAPAG